MSTVFIKNWGSISPILKSKQEVIESYKKPHHFLSQKNDWQGAISKSSKQLAEELNLNGAIDAEKLDRSVLLSLLASRSATESEVIAPSEFGVNIGSSRGATELFENSVRAFDAEGKISPLTSPVTTLGNLSSWVAQHIGAKGIRFSQSVTCSTGLQSVLNGIAYMKSGMANGFLAGATEAPLTDFTIGQMKALKIYTSAREIQFPNQGLNPEKDKNTFVLGEGAASFQLSQKEGDFKIIGWGFGNEQIKNATHISLKGEAMQRAMQMALKNAGIKTVDVVVCHAPGTLAGDLAEIGAIDAVFDKRPALTGNKWKIGHSLAASGCLSLEMALLMLEEQTFFSVPFLKENSPNKLETIMVNAAGFGGNSASLIIQKT
jgi:3-oxoacyl-(acyl-carrier-protein) synthase